MTTKTYTLEFGGYWLQSAISGMPSGSGIYGVYACTHDVYQNRVLLQRLLYIGEAADIRGRIANHDKWSEWQRQLRIGEVLCLNAALIAGQSDRQRAEAAVIFKHKPPCNTEYRNSFPFDTTTVATGGCNALLEPFFTTLCTENQNAALFARRW
jgi:hypothetical protein